MPENATIMKADRSFEKTCRLLADRKVIRDRKTGFEDICLMAGVDRMTIDNIFYERLGMSGEDVLNSFRMAK